jgi:hypothetical protein
LKHPKQKKKKKKKHPEEKGIKNRTPSLPPLHNPNKMSHTHKNKKKVSRVKIMCNDVLLGSLNSKEESKKSVGQKQKQKQVTKHRAPDKWMYK